MKEIIIVDSQRLNAVNLCAARYDMIFNQDLVSIEKADFLEKGDLLHKMLEMFYKLFKYRDRWERNKHDKNKIIQICIRVGNHHAVGMDLPIAEVEEIQYQFVEYCKFYEDSWEVLAVEQVASKVLYENDDLIIIYEGKIDLIVRIPNVSILPVDHKTSKRRGEVVALNNQFQGYAWLLDVKNVMVNKIGFQKTLKPAERFQRATISYNSDSIAEWVEDTIWWVMQMREFNKTGHYPRNRTSCDKWGGCVFRPICETERDARAYKAKQLFDVGQKWDVGAKL